MILPILDLDDYDIHEQIAKVAEEYDEWDNSVLGTENDVEETLDAMQALMGYLLKIVPDHDELEKQFEKHYQKLIDRKWDTNGHIELKFHYK